MTGRRVVVGRGPSHLAPLLGAAAGAATAHARVGQWLVVVLDPAPGRGPGRVSGADPLDGLLWLGGDLPLLVLDAGGRAPGRDRGDGQDDGHDDGGAVGGPVDGDGAGAVGPSLAVRWSTGTGPQAVLRPPSARAAALRGGPAAPPEAVDALLDRRRFPGADRVELERACAFAAPDTFLAAALAALGLPPEIAGVADGSAQLADLPHLVGAVHHVPQRGTVATLRAAAATAAVEGPAAWWPRPAAQRWRRAVGRRPGLVLVQPALELAAAAGAAAAAAALAGSPDRGRRALSRTLAAEAVLTASAAVLELRVLRRTRRAAGAPRGAGAAPSVRDAPGP